MGLTNSTPESIDDSPECNDQISCLYYGDSLRHLTFLHRLGLPTARKKHSALAKKRTLFMSFVQKLRQTYPERKAYIDALVNDSEPCRLLWLAREYDKFLHKRFFRTLSPEEKRRVLKGVTEWGLQTFVKVKKEEALRLGCGVTDIHATVPLEILYESEGQSQFANLPDNVLDQIMEKLKLADIFHTTSVCKRWREGALRNSRNIKRVEHALTTHLLTYTDWMSDPYDEISQFYLFPFSCFNQHLVEWCCHVSENIQHLVIDSEHCALELSSLLQKTPNLKFLQVGSKASENFSITYAVEKRGPAVHVSLPNLEFILFRCTSRFRLDLLAYSSWIDFTKIKGFMGSMDKLRWRYISKNVPVNNIFQNLEALHLTLLASIMLKELSKLEHLQLRYLRIDRVTYFPFYANTYVVDERTRTDLYSVIANMKKLEILIIESELGISNSTIQFLLYHKICLRLAVLCERDLSARSLDDELFVPDHEIIDFAILFEYQEMIRDEDPTIHLEDITIVLNDDLGRRPSPIDHDELEFTIKSAEFLEEMEFSILYGLDDPRIQRRLGFTF